MNSLTSMMGLGSVCAHTWHSGLYADANLQAQALTQNPEMALFAEMREVAVPMPHLLSWRDGIPLYHLAHAQPNKATPLVGADVKAVVLAFGGTGTGRSGVGMMRLAGSFRDLGVDLISVDHPFHGKGPRSLRAVQPDFYLSRILKILSELQKTEVPVFLLGHSFGAILIQELLLRFDPTLAGALMISPAGFQSPGLLAHYLAFRRSPEWAAFTATNAIQWNRVAEVWGEGLRGDGGIGGLFESVHHTGPIQTETPVWLIAGRDDPWSTENLVRELAERFQRHRLVMVDGAGHTQVLTFKEGKRKRTLPTLLFAEMAESLGIQLRETKRPQEDASILLALHQRTQLFRDWLAKRGITLEQILAEDALARKVYKEWWSYLTYEHIPHLARIRFSLEESHVTALRGGARRNPVTATRWVGVKVHRRRSQHIFIGETPLQECDPDLVARAIETTRKVEALIGKPQLTQGEASLLERYVANGFEVSVSESARVYLSMATFQDVVASF